MCNSPSKNVFCIGDYGLRAHQIRERKDDAIEEQLRGKSLTNLSSSGGYLPPCTLTINAFGRSRFTHEHEPRSFLGERGNPLATVEEEIGPATAGTWPFDAVYRKFGDEVEGEFADRFAPEDARRNLERFFGKFDERSLVFFYLNYDNPLNAERRKYVLVGVAPLEDFGEFQHWGGMTPKKARYYGTHIWNRLVRTRSMEGEGVLLPYQFYLDNGHATDGILVKIGPELERHFKYVCKDFTDDDAAILLERLIGSVERVKADGHGMVPIVFEAEEGVHATQVVWRPKRSREMGGPDLSRDETLQVSDDCPDRVSGRNGFQTVGSWTQAIADGHRRRSVAALF